MSDQGQQQQQQQQAPAFDAAPFWQGLDGEAKTFAERKGLLKPGDDGKLPSPAVLIDGWSNAEKLIGQAKLPEPRLDDPTELAKWPGHEKLGVPKDKKDYKFERPKMPDGIEYDAAAEDRFRDWAIKAHVPQFAFERLMTEAIADRTASMKAMSDQTAAERTRIETSLRKELGAGYDANMAAAQSALTYVAEQAKLDPKKTADMASAYLGSEETARMFLALGKMLGEGTLKGASDAGFKGGAAEARAEIDRLKIDEQFNAAWTNKSHPGHATAVQRMERLQITANA